jgi:hypothetical protein
MFTRPHLLPLGLQRLRLLDCLEGNSPRAGGYSPIDPEAELFGAFRQYVARTTALRTAERDPIVVSLLAAARLLTGEVAAATVIVDQLPPRPFVPDHGAGFCPLAPLQALRAALPLPAALADIRRWIAGSPEQAALRDWLAEHGGNLRWDEPAGSYHLLTG